MEGISNDQLKIMFDNLEKNLGDKMAEQSGLIREIRDTLKDQGKSVLVHEIEIRNLKDAVNDLEEDKKSASKEFKVDLKWMVTTFIVVAVAIFNLIKYLAQ